MLLSWPSGPVLGEGGQQGLHSSACVADHEGVSRHGLSRATPVLAVRCMHLAAGVGLDDEGLPPALELGQGPVQRVRQADGGWREGVQPAVQE